MTITWSVFLARCLHEPIFVVVVILTLGVILVNGWTDAPNAIATAVATRALTAEAAIGLAAVANFAGILVMTLLSATVAQTIYSMVDFSGDPRTALAALCAALLAIVIWAVAAWLFGIPTSESHALIAGLSGAAIALQGGLGGINGGQWVKVLYGLLIATLLGFAAGWLGGKMLAWLGRDWQRRRANRALQKAQIAGAAAMAFLHGAQDGQKFMGLLLLGLFLIDGQGTAEVFAIPFWLMLLCSVVMALGTAIGGRRIIKKVGFGLVRLEPYQGLAADLAGASCLLLCSLAGIPTSTTHTKTTAIMGVGAARRWSAVHWGLAGQMVWAWLLTFPGAGIMGFFFAKIMIYYL